MRAVWSSMIRGPPKTLGFSAMFAGPKMRVMIRARPGGCRLFPEQSTSSASAFRPSVQPSTELVFRPEPSSRLRQQHRRTSHPVAARGGCTKIPHARGHRARRGGTNLYRGISQPGHYAVRPPSSREGWSSLARRLVFVRCAPCQAALIAAPSGISPWVTQRQRAIRSFRASATIVTRRTRPRSCPTRARNQAVRALSG